MKIMPFELFLQGLGINTVDILEEGGTEDR